MAPYSGLEIAVDKHLAGSKVAVQFGNGPVYVSPAMYDLMKRASPEDLKALLGSIRIRRLPALLSVRELASAPMFTKAPL